MGTLLMKCVLARNSLVGSILTLYIYEYTYENVNSVFSVKSEVFSIRSSAINFIQYAVYFFII